jgi:hypothetical protein
VTLISLIVIAWISYDSARVMAEALAPLEQMESVRHVAIYGPWAMCVIAAIMLASMLVHVRARLARAREMRAKLQRAVQQEHAARQGAEEADHKKDQFLATAGDRSLAHRPKALDVQLHAQPACRPRRQRVRARA